MRSSIFALLVAAICAACINQPSLPSDSDLIDAVTSGDRSAVTTLLDKGGKATAVTDAGVGALTLAVAQGEVEIVEPLIIGGADLDQKDPTYYGATPLMRAVERNDSAIAELLLGAGANINAIDSNSDTALNWAAYYGYTGIAHLLIEAGADPTLAGHGNAFEIALRRGHDDVAELAARRTGSLKTPTDLERTLLQAVVAADVVAVKAALVTHADPEALSSLGRPVLAVAARWSNPEVLRTLIQAGATVDIEDPIGFTPLMEACRAGSIDNTATLLNAGAAINHRANPEAMSLTPLHLAAMSGNAELVGSLVQAGAEIDAQGRDGNTAMMWALGDGQIDVIVRLLELGADPDLINSDGDSLRSTAERYAIEPLLLAL